MLVNFKNFKENIQKIATQFHLIVTFFLLFKYLIYDIYFCMFTIIKEVRSSNLHYVMDFKNQIKLSHSRNGFMLNRLNSV